MHERIRKLRKTLNLTQQEFADNLNIKRGAIANYEIGRNEPIDAVISLICREYNVNEEWLRNGEGEMFIQLPEEDETAIYVSDLLEDIDNPFYNLIKDIMRTYKELDPKSQEALRDLSGKLRKNLEAKREG